MNLKLALAALEKSFHKHNGMSSPTRRAFELIRAHKPVTQTDFEKLFKLNKLGRGCSRVAYEIEGTSLVVKFEDYGADSDTKRELECYEILRRHRACLKYIPQIIYHAPGLLVLPRYKHIDAEPEGYHARNTMTELFKLAGVVTSDLHHNNVMRDRLGNIRCSDMGHFYIQKENQ